MCPVFNLALEMLINLRKICDKIVQATYQISQSTVNRYPQKERSSLYFKFKVH